MSTLCLYFMEGDNMIQNPVKEKKVLLSTNEMFLNSKSMVIEYHDVLRAHWFSLFYMIATGSVMDGIFDISMFKGMGTGELFEWYIFRKHRIFFYDLKTIHPFDSKESQDRFFNLILEDTGHIPDLYNFPTGLNLEGFFMRLISMPPNLVPHIYIYEGLYHEPNIQNQMRERYGDRITFDYIYGDFEKAIDGINKDCTYIISDIEKIHALERTKRLEYSSVLLTDGYRYNCEENDQTKLKIDLDELKTKCMCRCALFDNFPTEEEQAVIKVFVLKQKLNEI